MKDKYIAYYSENNELESFATFEEAKEWLSNIHQEAGTDTGFAEETMAGDDYIAEITHRSKFVEIANKCTFVPSEDEPEWPYEYNALGKIVMVKVTQ